MRRKDGMVMTGIAAVYGGIATSAMAQVGNIPDRNSYYHHGYDMMWGGNHWGGFGMLIGTLFIILTVAAIVVGVVYVLRQSAGTGAATARQIGQDRALAILKERYAKGEIDSEEFAERRKLVVD
ncbi:MAG: SHOCT domain-containing protein [Paracoccaceae bacterium]|nr:SHOCT domain-containing protein [Paracoccaceae bacterium]